MATTGQWLVQCSVKQTNRKRHLVALDFARMQLTASLPASYNNDRCLLTKEWEREREREERRGGGERGQREVEEMVVKEGSMLVLWNPGRGDTWSEPAAAKNRFNTKQQQYVEKRNINNEPWQRRSCKTSNGLIIQYRKSLSVWQHTVWVLSNTRQAKSPQKALICVMFILFFYLNSAWSLHGRGTMCVLAFLSGQLHDVGCNVTENKIQITESQCVVSVSYCELWHWAAWILYLFNTYQHCTYIQYRYSI